MNLQAWLRSLPASLLLLRCAAWLVPGRERAEWLAEWQAERWHVWNASQRESAAVCFCLGAFADAFWLRWNDPRSLPRRYLRAGSASRCSLFLAMWTAISLLLCLWLPGARRAMQPSPYQDGDGLVTISSGGYSGAQLPTIHFRDYQTWRTSTQRLFTDLAFYQPIVKRLHVAKHPGVELSIGRASDNLFKVLDLPIGPDAADPSGEPHVTRLFLSQESWSRLFGADPGMIGSVTEIAGQPVLIAGVVSQGPAQLPGRVDAWLLEDARQLARVPANSTGFVLAHLRTSRSLPQLDGWRYMNVRREDGSAARFDCISLAQRARLPFSIFLFTLIVALITLPATTALPLGEYPRHRGRLPWADRARQWIFLSGKFLLIVPLVSLASVDLAYGVPTLSATTAQYVQLATSFFGFLFSFRWILQDQRKRCPTCLRVLCNPARVGQASRNFLAWNGTELICAGGHGLLHIPELPTSWFDTQRWLYLDASWGSLFPEAHLSGLV